MDEFVSKLPLYQARKSEEYPNWLIVECGYEDCGQIFVVKASAWLRPRRTRNPRTDKVTVITGRSCPYCFRTGRIPARRDVKG